jgi:hypothetical protein
MLLQPLLDPLLIVSVNKVEFLPVYVPSADEVQDCIAYGRNVRALMASRLGIPVVELTFEDARDNLLKTVNDRDKNVR